MFSSLNREGLRALRCDIARGLIDKKCSLGFLYLAKPYKFIFRKNHQSSIKPNIFMLIRIILRIFKEIYRNFFHFDYDAVDN